MLAAADVGTNQTRTEANQSKLPAVDEAHNQTTDDGNETFGG